MAQWKPLTRAALPSIFTRASPTSTSFLFFFNERTGGLLRLRRLEIVDYRTITL